MEVSTGGAAQVFMCVIQDYRERATTKAPGAPHVDFVDILVGLKGEEKLHDREIVWLLSELILACTDNVSAIVEWTLANLMVHTRIQDKVHEEIDKVIGKRTQVFICHKSIYSIALPQVQLHSPWNIAMLALNRNTWK